MSSAHPSPGPSASSLPPTAPSRGRPSGLGIMAGAAEDKYRVKVRELKAKIRTVEQDNDKMYTKTLEAKRNIQRLRIERAIIYERLHAGPPQPPPSPPHAYRDVVLAPTDVEGAEYYRKRDIPVRPEIDPHTGQYIQVARAPALAPTSSSRSSRHPQQTSPLDTLPPTNVQGYYPPPPPAHGQPQYAPQPSHHHPNPSPGRAYSPPPPQSLHRHQRLGPGAIIASDSERDQQRVREWEAEQTRRHQPGQPQQPVYYDARYDSRAPERRYEYPPHHGHVPAPPTPADDRLYRDEREREYAHSHAHPHPHSHGHGHHQHTHSHQSSQADLTRARSGSSTSHAPHYERERDRERDVEMDDRTSA